MNKIDNQFESVEQLKQCSQILLNQRLQRLNIYCLKPDIPETKITYSYDPKYWTTIRDSQNIIRISDLYDWYMGGCTYQHLIPKIESIIHDLKNRGVMEVAIRGNPQLQNVTVRFCSLNKIKVANYPEEELPYLAQQHNS